MQTSKIVEIDGVFVGAAVLLPDSQGWRFVAADHRADAANGCTAATLHDAQQLAKRAFFTARSTHVLLNTGPTVASAPPGFGPLAVPAAA